MNDENGVSTATRVDPAELLRSQRDLAIRLAAATDLGEIAVSVRDAAITLAGVDAAGIYTSPGDGGPLRLRAHHGVSQQFVDRVREWRTDMSVGQSALRGRSVVVDFSRVAHDADLAELREEGLRCEVIIPVEVGGDIVLTMALASRTLDSIPDTVCGAAETIAYVAAQSVGRVLGDERRRAGEEAARASLQLQNELATALVSAKTMIEVAERIAEGLASADWIDGAGLYLVDDACGVARLVAHRGLSDEFAATASQVPLDLPEARQLLAGRSLYSHAGDQPLAAFQAAAEAAGFVGGALVPVREEERVRAILVALSRTSVGCPLEVSHGLEASALHVGATLRRLAAENALRNRERVLRQGERIAGIGSWRWEPESGVVWWSDEMYRIYGQDATRFRPSIGFLTTLVHPEDRDPDIRLLPGIGHESVSTMFDQRVLRADGSLRRVQMQLEAVVADDGALRAVLGVVQDLTDRRQIEAALARRVRYERAIAALAKELLGGAEGALERVLRELLVASDACRVYLFENYEHSTDGASTRQIAEACAPGVTPQIDRPMLRHRPWHGGGFERWQALLGAGQPVRGLVEHLPPGERAGLEPQGILSLLALPIFVDGRWWGFIGFDDTVVPRQWLDEDVLLLRTGADMVAAYLERQRDRQQLAERSREHAEAAYRLIARHLDEVVWTADLELHFSYVSPAVERVLSYDEDQLLRRSLVETLGKDHVRQLFELLAAELQAERSRRTPDLDHVVQVTMPVRCGDGTLLPCEHAVTFRRDSTGRPTGLIGVTRPRR